MFHMNGNRNERNIRNMSNFTNIQIYNELISRFKYLKKLNNQFNSLYIPYIEDKTNKEHSQKLLKFLDSRERRNNIKSIIVDTEPILEELVSRFYKVTIDVEKKINSSSIIFKYITQDDKGNIEDKVTYIGYIQSSRLFNSLDAIIDLKPRFDFIQNANENHVNYKFKDKFFIEIFRYDRNNFAHSSEIKGKQLHDFILAYFSTNTFSAPNAILDSNFYILDDYYRYKFKKSSKRKQYKIRSDIKEHDKFIKMCSNSFKKWYLQRYIMLDKMFDSFLELTDLLTMTINFKNREMLNDYISYEDFKKYEKFILNNIVKYKDRNNLIYNITKGVKKRELSEIITDTIPQFK